ncbi:MAG: cysteine--tRNA ligase, partial [Oscillospiraceae bacterium]|nr:cysteine--tRNA ligase [Oscillospiraceae bacterium]
QYRMPMNYSTDLLDACKASLDRLYQCRETLKNAISHANSGENLAQDIFDNYKLNFIHALEDDLNTADALTAIFELVKELNIMATNPHTSKEQLQSGLTIFEELISVLGLLYERKQEAIPQEILDLVALRTEARKAKNFAEADRLREEIKHLGYAVKETRQGVEITKL